MASSSLGDVGYLSLTPGHEVVFASRSNVSNLVGPIQSGMRWFDAQTNWEILHGIERQDLADGVVRYGVLLCSNKLGLMYLTTFSFQFASHLQGRHRLTCYHYLPHAKVWGYLQENAAVISDAEGIQPWEVRLGKTIYGICYTYLTDWMSIVGNINRSLYFSTDYERQYVFVHVENHEVVRCYESNYGTPFQRGDEEDNIPYFGQCDQL